MKWLRNGPPSNVEIALLNENMAYGSMMMGS